MAREGLNNFRTRFGSFFGSFFALFKPFFVPSKKKIGGNFVLQMCRLKHFLGRTGFRSESKLANGPYFAHPPLCSIPYKGVLQKGGFAAHDFIKVCVERGCKLHMLRVRECPSKLYR